LVEATNGGRERAFLDTLSQEQRDLVRYVQGMDIDMRAAWMAVRLDTIEKSLHGYMEAALLAQSTATKGALAAANPTPVTVKPGITISPGTTAAVTAGLTVLAGVLYAVIKLLGM
jgi:hypothetical protein